MSVQADPSDNSTRKLGLNNNPLVDMSVKTGCDKSAVKEELVVFVLQVVLLQLSE